MPRSSILSSSTKLLLNVGFDFIGVVHIFLPLASAIVKLMWDSLSLRVESQSIQSIN